MKFIHKYWWTIFLGFIFVLLFAVGNTKIDPDLGWHLKMGELILKEGIPHNDPFSYTMSSFEFVDHEWLTNVFMYLGYEFLGNSFMVAVYAGMVVLMLIVLVPKEQRIISLVGILLSLPVFISRFSFRPQVQSWLLFALLLRCFFDEYLWKKFKWFLPLGMLVWVNTHGSFALAIFVLAFLIFWKSIRLKKILFDDFLVWIVTLLFTFLNPYNWRIWLEVLTQITDRGIKFWIAEWLPFYYQFELGFLLLGVLFVVLSIRYFKLFHIEKTLLALVLLFAGLSTLRHIPLFCIAIILILPELFNKFINEFNNNKIAKYRTKKVFKLLVLMGLLIVAIEPIKVAYSYSGSGYNYLQYPDGGINYLKTVNFENNLLSDYGWGGYLIWKYPEKKVFIDGRMATWRWGVWPLSDQKPPSGESSHVFEEYKDLVRLKNVDEILNRYNVEYILWKSNKYENSTELFIEKFLNELIGIEVRELESLPEKLESMGWERVYSDEVSVVYRRSK